MAISDSQKVDLLFKKVGYGVAKTDTSAFKSPANEANASPLVSPGSTIYQQDYAIPSTTTLPTSNSSVITVYRDSLTSTVQCVKLPTTSANVSWTTGLTDWVPVQYGTGYQVKLYAGPAGSSTPQNYTSLPADGSGSSDSWYFDYQSGIVNFADTSVPSAANAGGNVVYVVGARYTGVKGIATFANLSVSGNVVANVISANSYTGNITGDVVGNINGNVTGTTATFSNISGNVATPNQPYITSVGTLSNLTVSGNANMGNVITSASFYGNVAADTISPYKTDVVAFTNITAVKLPAGGDSARPTGVAGYFRYNSDIASVEYYNGADWIPFNNQITEQIITPDGTTNSFTLNQSATAAGLIVSINGTLQSPGVAYTVSGTTITFAEVPKTSDIIDVRFIASAGTTTLDYEIVDTGNVSVGTSNVIVDSFNISIFRSAKYTISSSNDIDASMLELMVTQHAGIVVLNTVANVNTGVNSLSFYANIDGSTVNLVSQGTTNSNNLRIQRVYFNV